MPSTITHAYFAKDIYIDLKRKKNIDLEFLKTFAQGPDILFFYNIINLKKGKKIRELGKTVQKEKTQEFFINLITYIKDNNLKNKKEIMSFLYGFILHYNLDKTVHPFVIYKTGIFNCYDKSSYKYNGQHSKMETYIDCFLIKKNENINPKDFKVYDFCFNIDNFSDELKNTIDYTFKKTFMQKNMGNIYQKSIKQMKIFYRIFRYDKTKIKRIFYQFVDFLCPDFFVKKEFLSYNMRNVENDYLNKLNKTYTHPQYKNEKYNYSFDELYGIAKKDSINLINKVDEYLDNKNVNLKNEFKNLSYITGKNCNLKRKYKYFEH